MFQTVTLAARFCRAVPVTVVKLCSADDVTAITALPSAQNKTYELSACRWSGLRARNAEVFYLQSTHILPSCWLPVRSRSPAPSFQEIAVLSTCRRLSLNSVISVARLCKLL